MNMKILIVGESLELYGIKKRLELEGDEIVSSKNEAELIVTDDPDLHHKVKGIPIVGGSVDLRGDSLSYLIGRVPAEEPDFGVHIIKWNDRVQGFSPQTVVGFCHFGFMNENLGPRVGQGFSSRFKSEDEELSELFKNESLVQFLSEMRYTGFVDIVLDHKTKEIHRILTRVPCFGSLALFDSVPGKLSDFLIQGSSIKTHERWNVGLVLSRYPYPFQDMGERAFVRGLNEGVLKHFWPFRLKGFRKSMYIDDTLLGCSTATGTTVTEANRRALRTCRNIDLNLKQYRSDIDYFTRIYWGALRSSKFFTKDDSIDFPENQQTIQSGSSE